MLRSQVLYLQARAHGAVEDKDFLFEGIEIAAISIFTFGHVISFANFYLIQQTQIKKFISKVTDIILMNKFQVLPKEYLKYSLYSYNHFILTFYQNSCTVLLYKIGVHV